MSCDIAGLDISDIAKRLESHCDFASVGFERDLKEAMLNNLTFNTAYIMHGGGKASNLPNMHVINQSVEPRFGIVMVARSYGRKTTNPERAITDMQRAVRGALIGWTMPNACMPFYLVNEVPLKPDKLPVELTLWMDEFQTQYQFETYPKR